MSTFPQPPEALFLSLSGPFLGLDVGDARIGVAASDPTSLIARPLATVSRIPRKACLDRLESLLRDTEASGVVVGLPLLERGEAGEQAEKTRAFIRSLTRRIPRLPVAWWDERYTTDEARQHLEDRGERTWKAGQTPEEGRSRRDELAATFLLQQWLDERRRQISTE